MRHLRCAPISGCGASLLATAVGLALGVSLVCEAQSARAEPRGSGSARSVPGTRVIEQIEVLGVRSVSQDEIIGSLEVDVGDPLERARVLRSVQNIQALYSVRGFERVGVRSELIQPGNVLRITIQEGKPTRVGRVAITLPPELASRKLEANLASRIQLAPGELLDQEKLTQSKRGVLEALAALDYIGATLGEVTLTTMPPPEGIIEPRAELGTARYVRLELSVRLGDRVRFGFRGNQFLSNSELLALINDQRTTGLSTDYAAQLSGRMVAEYRKNAFAQARVDVITQEHPAARERQVTFVIDEGVRYRLERVEFEGVSAVSREQLQAQFELLAPRLVQRGYYVEEQVTQAIDAVVAWMRSQGYLFARSLATHRVELPRARSSVPGSPSDGRYRVTAYLYEGDQTRVRKLSLSGVSALASDRVWALLGVAENQPLNLVALSEGLEAVKAAYRALGYLDVRLSNEATLPQAGAAIPGGGSVVPVVSYSAENRLADVSLIVEEGTRYRVSRVDIEGLTQTRREVVARELQIHPGDYLEEVRITESQTRLRRLGVFSVVTFRDLPDPADPSRKILRVSIQEGTPGTIGAGVGYRNDLGARVFGQVGYANLGGRNQSVTLNTSLNRNFNQGFCDNSRFIAGDQARLLKERDPGSANCFLEYQLQLLYTWPWFMFGETTFRPQIALSRIQFFRFDTDITSLNLSLDRRLFWTPLSGTLAYSLERVRQFNAPEVDTGVFRIGSLTPAIRLDLRDNPLAPTRGLFVSTSYEISNRYLLSQLTPVPIAFTRWQFRSDYHLPLSRNVGWYVSFRTGVATNRARPPRGQELDPRFQIPIIKQFTLGGIGSLRGFREQQLNFTEVAVQNYMSFVNYRTQLDLPFVGDLKFSPFLDAGNIRLNSFGFDRLRYGAGVGFRYLSPVGPVNFDLGFNLRPELGEDRSRFYFSVGVI